MFRCARCLLSAVIRITASVDEHKPREFFLFAIAMLTAPVQLFRDGVPSMQAVGSSIGTPDNSE
jgi:hypothetical protein